ncbi:MAG: hypothetical protein NC827_03825 [Candidatus Omnitrophica bacterium]|nr:hypothetical protein [Candidatus Omnitrophota bacterium]MCM8802422.1 hypothetical protein [Candidatus Omnitrophota bacterium]
MKKGNCLRLNILLILFFTFCSFLYAGRPLTTDDSGTVEKGKFELEIGYDFTKNNDKAKNYEIGISLKYGITDWMDLGISAPFIIKESDLKVNEWGRIEIGTKFSILKESEKIPGISFTISGTPRSNEGDTEFSLNSIISKNFGKTTWHLNLGTYSQKTSSGSEYFFTYSTAFEYTFTEKLNLVGEIVGENNEEKPLEILFGLNYVINDYIVYDIGFSKGLNNDAFDWRITIGFTFNW